MFQPQVLTRWLRFRLCLAKPSAHLGPGLLVLGFSRSVKINRKSSLVLPKLGPFNNVKLEGPPSLHYHFQNGSPPIFKLRLEGGPLSGDQIPSYYRKKLIFKISCWDSASWGDALHIRPFLWMHTSNTENSCSTTFNFNGIFFVVTFNCFSRFRKGLDLFV